MVREAGDCHMLYFFRELGYSSDVYRQMYIRQMLIQTSCSHPYILFGHLVNRWFLLSILKTNVWQAGHRRNSRNGGAGCGRVTNRVSCFKRASLGECGCSSVFIAMMRVLMGYWWVLMGYGDGCWWAEDLMGMDRRDCQLNPVWKMSFVDATNSIVESARKRR